MNIEGMSEHWPPVMEPQLSNVGGKKRQKYCRMAATKLMKTERCGKVMPVC